LRQVVGLSRRFFTKEFKLAAVRRLEQGISIAEVARGLEVNPNVLHRWRREMREGPGNVFPWPGETTVVGWPGSGLTVRRMVKLAQVSRASFYRFDENAESGPDPDMDLRDAIQRTALKWPSYGRRRITAELRRQGWTVNPKRVYRVMREDNLLCVRRRKFVVTTDSNHGRKIYPNLAATAKAFCNRDLRMCARFSPNQPYPFHRKCR
jgi:transposase-like protein